MEDQSVHNLFQAEKAPTTETDHHFFMREALKMVLQMSSQKIKETYSSA